MTEAKYATHLVPHSPENKACFNGLDSVLLLVIVVLPSSVRAESIVYGQTILLDSSIGNFYFAACGSMRDSAER
jgi:hypothetical protein